MDHATPTLVQRGEARVAEALAALPPGVQRALSARRPVRIDGDELDPGIQLLLRVRELRGRPSLISGPDAAPADERANLRREIVALVRKPTPVAAVHELELEGAGAALPARHYVPPERGGPHPLLVFLHGGGWTIGDLDTHDEPSRLLCRNAGVHVLSVGYRLAPEHGFPVPVEDALAAWRWAHANASRLGADPERVAIGGDSAGGNLSAVAAHALAREGGPAPALQVLIYPATDVGERSSRSSRLFGEGFFLTNGDRDWFERQYLAASGAQRSDPRVSPLRGGDVAGAPPAIVLTAAFDPLRDEGEAYAAALRAAEVPVATFRAGGLIHGFINLTAVNRASRDALLVLAGMIRAAV